jgi:CheY-like chemotaxis protein
MQGKHARPSVLLVEAEEDLRADIASWLAEAGFDVASCAGPHLSAPACPFERAGPCQLVRAADVVVIDDWLESDTLMDGPPGWELAVAYRALGLPIVVLSRAADPVRFEGDVAALIRAVKGFIATSEGSSEDWVMDARPAAPRDRKFR